MAKSEKQTFQQSFADATVSLRELGAKISPHLGFIYLAFILAGVTATVFVVNQTMQSTDLGAAAVTSEKANEYVSLFNFDASTANKIKLLSTTNGTDTITLPSGRINPFSESVY